jgi:hypothetical protein
MNTSAIKNSVSSLLFLLMLFLAFMLIRPVYTRLYVELDAYRLSALEKLEQTAGIGLAYQSLSPSILSAFRIKSILVFDSETRKALFQIDNVLFFYDIWQLCAATWNTLLRDSSFPVLPSIWATRKKTQGYWNLSNHSKSRETLPFQVLLLLPLFHCRLM